MEQSPKVDPPGALPPVIRERERNIGRIGRTVAAIAVATFALLALFKPG